MNYILNDSYSLRSWKNKPYCICMDTAPVPPIPIGQELTVLFSDVFAYHGGDARIDQLIQEGILRTALEGEELTPERRYLDYGCLYFESVIFSITGQCNYHCLHCSVNAPKTPMGEIPFSRIESLLDEMRECGLKNVVLIGGEPLIRKDFLQIVDAVTDRGMLVAEIFTNGSLVDETLLNELSRRQLKPLFMISFDGVGFHDIMRGVKGAEESFFRCVDLLSSRGLPISCNMCVTKDSLHSLWDTITILAEKGVSSLTVYPPVECGLWKDRIREMGASMDLICEVYTDVIEKYVSADYPLNLNLYGMIQFVKRLRGFALTPYWRHAPEKASISPACKVHQRELNISPEGILSPCYAIMADDYIRSHMPDLHQVSLKQALTDSAFTRLMELTAADIAAHNPKCRTCPHLSMCAGGCRMSAFEKTGDFLGYDPQMCYFFEKGMPDQFRKAVTRGRQARGNSRNGERMSN